jgi:DNA helicase-2/ATP-dependent DNA helicase PcrA
MSEGSLLDDMNNFLNDVSREQDEERGVEIIRPNVGDNKTNLELFYKKLTALGINLDELGGILEEQGNMLVISGAGSGKTTALILRIIKDLISGDAMRFAEVQSIYGRTQVMIPANILVSTFLKTGAEELQKSFNEWCYKLGVQGIDQTTIKFSTIHKEVKDAITQMGVNVNVLEDSDRMVRSVMQKYSIRSNTATARNVTIDEIKDIASLVSFMRNRLDAKRYEHPLMAEYSMNAIIINAVLQDLALMRKATGCLDFEDMQEILLDASRTNPAVREFISKRYDYVYIDEFQDTSQLQYELLKYYFTACKRVIAIGDDDQSIYSWRGGDSDIIGRVFEQEISVAVMTLSTNYRCRANILNSIIPSIELNTNRHVKQLKAHKEGGEVNLVLGGDVNHLVNSMRDDLGRGFRVGVLARTNADLLIPAMILELDGGVEFGLSKSVNMNSRLARQVFGAMDLVTKRFTEEFSAHFKMFLPRYQWFESDKLSDILMMNRNTNLYNIPLDDLVKSVPTLAPLVKGLREAKTLGGVEAYLYLLGCMEKQAFNGTTLYAQKARDLVNFTRRIIMDHKDVRDKNIEQIDNLFNSVLPERLARRIKYAKDVFSKLSTIHEAKGKEWDSVYIWNDVEGSFPNKVGNRELTADEYEEERRVHYIAWTRAKEKLTVFSEENRMGAFLKECDLTLVGATVTSHVEVLDMQKVFKTQRDTTGMALQNTDTILRAYIANVTGNGGLTDERVSNIEIVLSTYQFDDLVTRVENKYGIHLTKETEFSDVLDLFFRDLADEVYNNGTMKAY